MSWVGVNSPLRTRSDLISYITDVIDDPNAKEVLNQFHIDKTLSGFCISVKQARQDDWLADWVGATAANVRIYHNSIESYIRLEPNGDAIGLVCPAMESTIVFRMRYNKTAMSYSAIRLTNDKQKQAELQISWNKQRFEVELLSIVSNPLRISMWHKNHPYGDACTIIVRVYQTKKLRVELTPWSNPCMFLDLLSVNIGSRMALLQSHYGKQSEEPLIKDSCTKFKSKKHEDTPVKTKKMRFKNSIN